MKPNCLTITYLSKVSFASLNGADKEVDNINPIKKVTLSNGEELPYVSSQAIRRALRDRLEEMGHPVTEIHEPSTAKAPIRTSMDATKYIDDDLFGYMDADSRAVRTSPVRVESLVALSPFKGDLDYATNYMGVGKGSEPNIFETEIHSGYYRGTVLIELDRVGRGFTPVERNKKTFLEPVEYVSDEVKAARVIALLEALQMLWSSGRQSRFLADISPKFIAAAYLTAKNPIFLEAVNFDKHGKLEVGKLQTVVSDYEKFIVGSVFGAQEAVIERGEGVLGLKDAFATIESWVHTHYQVAK